MGYSKTSMAYAANAERTKIEAEIGTARVAGIQEGASSDCTSRGKTSVVGSAV